MKFINYFLKLKNSKEKQFIFPFQDLSFTGENLYYLIINLAKTYDKYINFSKIKKVSIIYENSIEYIAISFYLILKKKIVVPINPLLSPKEVKQIIQHSKSNYVISSKNFAHKIKSIKNQIIFDYDSKKNLNYDKKKLKFSDFFKNKLSINDIILLLYTSGSTGLPKGALLTLGNILSNAKIIGSHHKINNKTNTLVLMPMFHNNGFIISFLSTFLKGGTTVIAPANLVIYKFWEIIRKYNINYTSLMPSVLTMIMRFGGSAKNKSLRYIACGGQKLSKPMLRKFEKKYNLKVIEHYGLTETTSISTVMPLANRNINTVGKVIRGTKIKMLDIKSLKLNNYGYGEICILGPNVFKGYYDNKILNKEKRINGYLRSGDYGFKDKFNNVYFASRKDFLIIKSGENIYPAEIENKIYEIKEVVECAVIGYPDKIYGEEIYGFVKLKKKNIKIINKINYHLNKSLAKFKVPKKLFFLERDLKLKELPKTATKKIKYKDLKKILKNEFKKKKFN